MYQSRWAPKHLQRDITSLNHERSNTDSQNTRELQASEQLNSTWSDPALQQFDEATNSMDIDFQVPLCLACIESVSWINTVVHKSHLHSNR